MKKTNLNDEMMSLNSEFSEFSLQQLEERLETDPLAVGGLLDLTNTDENGISLTGSCTENVCYGIFI